MGPMFFPSFYSTTIVHYFKFSADEGNAQAQLNYGFVLYSVECILRNESLSVHYDK
jgi:hypothetical protein